MTVVKICERGRMRYIGSYCSIGYWLVRLRLLWQPAYMLYGDA